jgi:hypothetical protein
MNRLYYLNAEVGMLQQLIHVVSVAFQRFDYLLDENLDVGTAITLLNVA